MLWKVTRSDDCLAHHGIKGQKWGVRNGPPYPLEYDDKTGLEKTYDRGEALEKYTNEFKTEKHGVGASKYLTNEYDKIAKGVKADYDARRADLEASRAEEIKRLNDQKSSLTKDQYDEKLKAINTKYGNRSLALMQENTQLSRDVIATVNAKILRDYGSKSFNDFNEYISYKKYVPSVYALVNASEGLYEFNDFDRAIRINS